MCEVWWRDRALTIPAAVRSPVPSPAITAVKHDPI